jgi:hypothetical protein
MTTMNNNAKFLALRAALEEAADTSKDLFAQWKIIEYQEDPNRKTTCVCGQKKCKFLATVRNIHTNRCVTPIGSSCILKFDNVDLTEELKSHKSIFDKNKKRIKKIEAVGAKLLGYGTKHREHTYEYVVQNDMQFFVWALKKSSLYTGKRQIERDYILSKMA